MTTDQAALDKNALSELHPAPSFLSQARRQPLIMLGFVLLVIFVLAAVFAPQLSPTDPLKGQVVNSLKPPSPAHLFCTDKPGREIVRCVMCGALVRTFRSVFSQLKSPVD